MPGDAGAMMHPRLSSLPTGLLRTCAAALLRVLCRVEVRGLEHLRAAGARVMLVANHPSLIDGLLLYLFLPLDPVFAVSPATARRPWVRTLLRLVDWHELDTLNPGAIKSLTHLLRDGRALMIFPEGRVATSAALMKIYEGAALIAEHAEAEVLPVAIDGPQYSHFSGLRGKVQQRCLPAITLTVLPARRLAVPAEARGSERRARAADALLTTMLEVSYAAAFHHETLFAAVVRAGRNHGMSQCVLEDATGARLRYRDLLTRALVLGGALTRQLGERERVGVLLPSTAATVVTLLACASRGRQAAMLNFTAGARGLVTAIETGNVRLVVTSRAFIQGAALEAEVSAIEGLVKLVYLEDLRATIGPLAKLGGALAARVPLLALRLLGGAVDAGQAAVVLFTSGSEGIPKGVVLSHANLLANFAQVQSLLDLTRGDRVLNVLPVFHAFGLLGGVLLPLLKGCPSYQYPSPLHYRLVPELCYELNVTCLFGTNTFLRAYAQHAHDFDMQRMRYVIAGAERLTDDTRALWGERFGVRIFEGYGATEASPVIAVNHPLAARRGSVGRLLAMTEHYLEPVEGIAEGGELVVRGPNIMQGYLFHGSDGTIIPPWTQRNGAGWYATGDIVALDDDGYVSIKGRAKRFAKVGGEMVSLAIIEELAAQLWPRGIHAALAVADARKGEQIVLFSDTEAVNRADLLAALRTAAHSELALPRHIIHHDAMPLLGSGKINYPALRELYLRQQA
jgi:acyl-[acyl-carrier-protein]-phospholipid O-acyltransferase/long-chain-fatty-acid--[acyl-carrier-protein] ligase